MWKPFGTNSYHTQLTSCLKHWQLLHVPMVI